MCFVCSEYLARPRSYLSDPEGGLEYQADARQESGKQLGHPHVVCFFRMVVVIEVELRMEAMKSFLKVIYKVFFGERMY